MIGTMNEEDWITPNAARALANIIIKAADYAEGKNQMTDYTPVPVVPHGVILSSGIGLLIVQMEDIISDVIITDGDEIIQEQPITRDDIQKIHDFTGEILNHAKENISCLMTSHTSKTTPRPPRRMMVLSCL